MKNLKKNLLLILLVCMAITLTVSLSSCDIFGGGDNTSECQHVLNPVAEVKATCTEKGMEAYYICANCDKLFADAEGGVEIDAPKIIEAKGHDYKKTVYPATCTEVGYTKYSCFNCEHSYTADEVAKTEHSFTKYESNDDATCTADGTETAKCDRCDENDTKTVADSKLGHNYGTDWASDASGHWYVCANGCNVKGDAAAHTPNMESATENEDKICTVCDYVIEEALGHITHDYNVPKNDATHHWNQCYGCNEISEKVEHTYSESIIKDSTCTATGTKKLTCTCGHSKEETIPVKKHSYTVKTISENTKKSAADCNNAAVYYYSCSCGEISTTETFEDGVALGHEYTEKKLDEAHLKEAGTDCQTKDTYWFDCSRCDSISNDKFFEGENVGKHKVSTAWTTKDGKHFYECTVDGCDYIEGEEACFDADNDNNHNCDVCNADGVTSHAYGEWEKADETNHKKICNCGDIVTEAHSFTKYKSNDDATCTADGTKTAKCDNCDAKDTQTDEGTKLAHTYDQENTALEGALKSEADCENAAVYYKSCSCGAISNSIVFTSGSPLGHDETSHEAKEPTCTEVGYDAYVTCNRCDYTTYNEKKALNHNYEWVVDAEPTFDTTGIKHEECTRCHVKRSENTEIPVNICKHEFTETPAKEATCLTAGNKAYYTCSICGKIYSNEEGTLETTVENSVIAALGHDEQKHNAKAPTCTEGGYDAYVTCSRCDYTTYADKEALGHDEISHEAKAPTCTEKGWEAYETCSRCDYTTYVEIGSIGHAYESVVTDPTCENQGYTTHTCKNDGTHTYVDSYVNALGHSYGEWTLVTSPTYEVDGVLSRICATCQGTDEKNIGTISADNNYTLLITGVLSRWQYEIDGQTFSFDIIENVTVTDYKFGLESFYIGAYVSGSLTYKEGYKHTNATAPEYDCCFMDGEGKKFTTTVVVPKTTSVTLLLCAARNTASYSYSQVLSSLTVNGKTTAVLDTTSATINFTGWHNHTYYEMATIVLEEGTNVIEFTSKGKINYAGVGFKSTEEVHMHTEVIAPSVAPTCTETGKTEGMHCSTCNAVIVAQESVAATGHINAWTHTMTTKPTYTIEGLIESVEACTVCKLVNATNSVTVPAVSADVEGYELLVTGVASRWQYTYDGAKFIIELMNTGVVTNTYSFGVEAWYVDRNDAGTPIGVEGLKHTTATWKVTTDGLIYYYGDRNRTYTTTITVDKPTAVTLLLNCARNKAMPFYTDGEEWVLDWIKVNGSEDGVIYNKDARLTSTEWHAYADYAVATLFLDEGTNVISFDTFTTTNFKGIGFMSTEEIKLAEDIVEIDLMSFNIRVNEDWAARKADLMASIIKYNPGVVCFQEVSKTQANDLSNGLTAAGYEFIWYARQSGDNPEGLAIAYRTDLFNKVSDGVFWLSDTPNTMSKGWDDKYYRICVHALLQHKTSGQYLNVFSVHLGLTVTSQVNGMQLILDEAAKYDYPTYIAGDFNCYDYSTAYLNTAKSFIDCQKRAPKTEISNTFHSWGKYAEDGTDHIIDFCFVSKNHFVPLEFAVHQDKVSDGSSYLSDHFPIMTKVALLVPHTHTEKVDEEVDAGCESTGLTEGKHCTSCGEVLVAQETTEMLGHIYTDSSDADCDRCGFVRDFSCAHANKVAVSAKDATCTEAGNTAGEMCTDCGEVFVDEIFPALGHTNAAAVIENEVTPTFDAAGSVDRVVYCSVCNFEISREKLDLPALNLVDYTTETTVSGSTATTVFAYNNDKVNYSATLTATGYININDVIYSCYDVAKLNSDGVLASYDTTNGFTYHAISEQTLTFFSNNGASLTLTGTITVNATAQIIVAGGNLIFGNDTAMANVTINSSVNQSILIDESAKRKIIVSDGSSLNMPDSSVCAIRFSKSASGSASNIEVYGTLNIAGQISCNRYHNIIVYKTGSLSCGSINNGRYNHIQVYGTMNVKGNVTQTESAKITVHDGGDFTIGGNAAIQTTLTVNGKMYVAGNITGVSTFTVGATGNITVVGTANKAPTVTDGGYALINGTPYGTAPTSEEE